MSVNEYFARRGKRLESNRVKVRLTANGQFSLTIPRALALGYNLKKGSIVVFEPLKQGGIKISKIEEPENDEHEQ